MSIPYNDVIRPLVDLVKIGNVLQFKQVVAAESYLGLLIDGGTLRTYYPGLKAALGQTIGGALGGEEPIILPVDLDSITWEEIKLEKLATPVAFFLKISVCSTLLILQHLQLMPPDIASPKNIWLQSLCVTTLLSDASKTYQLTLFSELNSLEFAIHKIC